MRWTMLLLTALLLFYLIVSPACGWQSDNEDGTFTNSVLYADYPDPDSGATGIHDLYLRFTGTGNYLFNINWWQFIRYGDMNRDAIVNTDDLLDFFSIWLQENCDLDLDGDCEIHLYEFAVFAGNWLDDSYR